MPTYQDGNNEIFGVFIDNKAFTKVNHMLLLQFSLLDQHHIDGGVRFDEIKQKKNYYNIMD